MSVATNTKEAVGRSAMNKAFWRILLLIGMAYLFAFMDRVNVGFAAAQMNEDLKFSATVYGLGGGLFFLAYALFAIPSNLMLVRFGARQWIALTMIAWGLLSAAMMFVQTPTHFYTLRFLLGVAEAGFYPGVIFYFSGWFPPCHRGRAVSRFFVASPLASVVMGGVSGWLLTLDGHIGLHDWQLPSRANSIFGDRAADGRAAVAGAPASAWQDHTINYGRCLAKKFFWNASSL